MKPLSKLQVGIIGCGNHSHSSHLTQLSQMENVKIRTICDKNIDVLNATRKEFKIDVGYQNYKEMLEKESENLDGVFVILHPRDNLASVAIDCLKARIPTSIEKPPASNMEELNELLKVAQETKTPHMVGFNRRFDPVAGKAKSLMAAKKGPFHYVARFYRNYPDEKGIGAFVHAVDTLLWLGGGWGWKKIESLRTGKEDGFQVLFYFKDGSTGILSALRTAGRDLEEYEIHGDRSSVYFNYLEKKGSFFDSYNSRGLNLHNQLSIKEGTTRDSKYYEVAYFVDRIKKREKMSPDLEAACETMKTVTEILGSSVW